MLYVSRLSFGISAVAAATENDNDSKDNYPGTVVVEEMAKAIVVHVCLPPGVTCGFCSA